MKSQLEGLYRSEVVRAALRAIDEHGLDSLTIRRLDRALGTVNGPWQPFVTLDELLDAVAEWLLSDVNEALDVVGSWQGYLQGLAHALRRVALQHPQSFPLVATPGKASPWLWPPFRDVALVERFLSTLLKFGFSETQATETSRAVICFVLRQLLLEAALRRDETSQHVGLTEAGPPTPPASSATTLRLQPLLAEDRDEEGFEIGLEQLLDRLELRIAPRGCRAATSTADEVENLFA